MSVVYILSFSGLLDTFLLSIVIECSDVSYYTEVYWLLCQKVFEALYELIGLFFLCSNKILAM
jgi:hypothetical protein